MADTDATSLLLTYPSQFLDVPLTCFVSYFAIRIKPLQFAQKQVIRIPALDRFPQFAGISADASLKIMPLQQNSELLTIIEGSHL
jgi:hypothetical protein